MAVSSIFLLLGGYLRKRSVFLEHFCVPVAFVGGIFVAGFRLLVHLILDATIVFDATLLPIMFLAFFTTIGLNGSITLFKYGGFALFLCVMLCWGLTVVQNGIGIALAGAFNLNPVLGVLVGAASLEGGHGTAIAFGAVVENFGVVGAEAVGIAAATFGLLAGSSLGGPIAKFLITRHKLKIETSHNPVYIEHLDDDHKDGIINPAKFMRMLAIVLFCMAIGSWLGEHFNIWTKRTAMFKSFALPEYIWAMLMAIIVRNVGDRFNIFKRCSDSLGLISTISLRFAMIFAVMGIRVTELQNIALPLLAILFIQTAIVVIFSIFIFFPILGKDYDAAVMSAGLCGLGLGATHNAMSNMITVCDAHKVESHKAFLVVSLCGAALVDIFLMPFTSVCINLLL